MEGRLVVDPVGAAEWVLARSGGAVYTHNAAALPLSCGLLSLGAH